MIAKQDKVQARTPAQLKQEYDFTKSFAEVMGIANDARTKAEEAASATSELDDNLTAEEIFNRLTENGKLQGLYRGEDGELYINAEFIKSLEKMFANDITMSGKFTYETETFIEPGEKEIEAIRQHLLGTIPIPSDRIPLYDFNSDGELSIGDIGTAKLASLGLYSLANWSGAIKTKVKMTIDFSNPQKLIRITGTNMWGNDVDSYIGLNFTSIKNPETEQKISDLMENYIVESGTEYTDVGTWYYHKFANGTVHCWCTTNKIPVTFQDGNWFNVGNYAHVVLSLPSFFVESPYCVNINPFCINDLFFASINGITLTKVYFFCAELGVTGNMQVPMQFTVSAYGKWQ